MPAIAAACSNTVTVTDHLIIVPCAFDPAQQNPTASQKPLMRDAGVRAFPPESNRSPGLADAPDFIFTDTVWKSSDLSPRRTRRAQSFETVFNPLRGSAHSAVESKGMAISLKKSTAFPQILKAPKHRLLLPRASPLLRSQQSRPHTRST